MTTNVMKREAMGSGRKAVLDRDGVKVCPRCGAKTFADMDVCYGCLYDFTTGEGEVSLEGIRHENDHEPWGMSGRLSSLDEPSLDEPDLSSSDVAELLMGKCDESEQVPSQAGANETGRTDSGEDGAPACTPLAMGRRDGHGLPSNQASADESRAPVAASKPGVEKPVSFHESDAFISTPEFDIWTADLPHVATEKDKAETLFGESMPVLGGGGLHCPGCCCGGGPVIQVIASDVPIALEVTGSKIIIRGLNAVEERQINDAASVRSEADQ